MLIFVKDMSVWAIANSVVSPLGVTSEENYTRIRKNDTAISVVNDTALSPTPFFAGRLNGFYSTSHQTKFEAMCLRAAEIAVGKIELDPERTLYVLSTTKGNISLLEQPNRDHPRIQLHATAHWLASRAGLTHYLVVSNACISGVLALIVAKRLLDSGKYDHAVIVGADVLSKFVVSGFQSLQALSPEPCKPFDAERKGINLGEAAAAVVLSSQPDRLNIKPSIKIAGGGLSNDANHISGPSRTGEELAFAIRQALAEAEKSPDEIDFISAHGTATVFNDEMEANAFHHAGMGGVPLNSLKGYFGHTLGAAGVVETVMSIHSLLNNEILATKGFEKPGVSQAVRVSSDRVSKPLTTCLKTASGFGGCNSAIVLQKENNF
jgi:3-oxoacyl-[acyl-carrier-protein] synthase-1